MNQNKRLTKAIYNEIINSEEYKKYCETYKVVTKESENEITMYLMWKSFGCSL